MGQYLAIGIALRVTAAEELAEDRHRWGDSALAGSTATPT